MLLIEQNPFMGPNMGFFILLFFSVKPQNYLVLETNLNRLEHYFLTPSKALTLYTCCPLCIFIFSQPLPPHFISTYPLNFHCFTSLCTPFDFELSSLTGFLYHLSILDTKRSSFLCALPTNPPSSSHQCQPGS